MGGFQGIRTAATHASDKPWPTQNPLPRYLPFSPKMISVAFMPAQSRCCLSLEQALRRRGAESIARGASQSTRLSLSIQTIPIHLPPSIKHARLSRNLLRHSHAKATCQFICRPPLNTSPLGLAFVCYLKARLGNSHIPPPMLPISSLHHTRHDLEITGR